MPKPPIVRLAEEWKPDPADPLGADKTRLVRFLLKNGITSENPITIKRLLAQAGFHGTYSREQLQHQLLGPLRRSDKLFVGTSSRGVFLVTTPEDADTTLGFYTWRIRAELRHARNLRTLAKRTKLFDGHKPSDPGNKQRAVIYVDESGTPDVTNHTPPVFVVAAVVLEGRQDVATLEQRFKNAFVVASRPEDHELKTSGLSVAKHAKVLRELSLLDYQWAAACFHKPALNSAGFSDPKTFYRYAFQFLIADLLQIAWQAELVIDESSTSSFQNQLKHYLKKQNSGLPVNKLTDIGFSSSSQQRLIQLADLIAGAVRRAVTGSPGPLREIEHRKISLQFWPPKPSLP
jgi:hypothetical protein